GLGGYSEAALNSQNDLKIVAFDLDGENLKMAKVKLAAWKEQVNFVHDNFANLEESLKDLGVEKINGVMLDLGLSSPQIDLAERGFSFMREGDLDMRFDKRQQLTAAEIVNKFGEVELARIFWELGEERMSRRIARAIVERRREKPFTKTTEFADFVAGVVGGKKGKIHPATKVFQALRIAVNHELDSLQKVLVESLEMLASKGRIAVVSYHSLEDRIVKNFFREAAREYINLPDQLTTTELEPKIKIITKKPIVPSAQEIAENPRARSAKLRVAEKI
ncbi:16S rRNA (cytosine(1402)-N(4))-methyltransferase RsmH, partial [Candidatus Peregrinibacteria bacterium]|nr:16S rRNA (cytosine(1402)-N(4))-methyltransferase RsmH [Candidatus Peregrinibacteria bacterium]